MAPDDTLHDGQDDLVVDGIQQFVGIGHQFATLVATHILGYLLRDMYGQPKDLQDVPQGLVQQQEHCQQATEHQRSEGTVEHQAKQGTPMDARSKHQSHGQAGDQQACQATDQDRGAGGAGH